jgi:hypothetical protein
MKNLLIMLLSCIVLTGFSQCPTPTGLFTTNITSYNALANWSSVAGADHYKIRYKRCDSVTWNNLGNINSMDTTRNIPLLQQNTCYEWEIMSFCDSTNQLGSNWAIKDTFTTGVFIPATFAPSITYDLSSLECSQPSELLIKTSQLNNEPDIASSKVYSNGGSFELTNIAIGDSVGHSILNTNTQTINATLKYGGQIGLDIYQINVYNSFGMLIGTFNIENKNPGISVLSVSPNDGNNYTSGYNSCLYINNIFINPPDPGLLHFYAEVDSELNHQTQDSSSVQVWCITHIDFLQFQNQTTKRFDMLGRGTKEKKNQPLFYILDDGTVKKKIILD